MMIVIIICILIAVLAAVDYFTTEKILQRGGVELNPVMKWCVEQKLFAPVKAALTLFVIVSLLFAARSHPVAAGIAGCIIAAGYCWIIRHNWRQLK